MITAEAFHRGAFCEVAPKKRETSCYKSSWALLCNLALGNYIKTYSKRT